MPKKNFQYKNPCGMKDVWCTDSLKGWFIVKDKDIYVLRKGSINSDNTIEFGTKHHNTYLRLGDAKVGLENKCKERVQSIIAQQALFDQLKAEYENKQQDKGLDYEALDKQVERLKAKWGVR